MNAPGKRVVPPGVLLLGLFVAGGCSAVPAGTPLPTAVLAQTTRPAESASEFRQVAHFQPAAAGHVEAAPAPAKAAPPASPFAGMAELSVEAVVQEVLSRNPTLAQMIAAWQAASARYPQVTALEDPMFGATVGPGTISPDDVGLEFAYRLEISQKLPYPGKLKLRGANALAEASAAGHDVDDVRLQLVESARTSFYDYYLAARALEVNAENLELLKKFEATAGDRYEKGLVPQSDWLQARVELGREQDRRLALEEARQIAVARINTLLHLPADSPLPPPPKELELGEPTLDVQALRSSALARRPDLQALAEHIAAEEAMLGLAHKEFYPDFEPFFMYDRFMGNVSDNRDLASMLGVRLNLPVYRSKRHAAVAEAEAKVAQRRAELAKQTDQVNFQVQEAYEKVIRSERSVRLYTKTILPDAKSNVEAAQSAYETGKVPFVALIEAQRNRVMLRDRYYEAIADYFRRRATLERVIGGPLVTTATPGGR
jgi:outer membrane protein TolC